MSLAPKSLTAVSRRGKVRLSPPTLCKTQQDSPTDISLSLPAWVVLWPTDPPTETPAGPLCAVKPNARLVKTDDIDDGSARWSGVGRVVDEKRNSQAGAMNAPSPAAI
jgi:hypothetical protein